MAATDPGTALEPKEDDLQWGVGGRIKIGPHEFTVEPGATLGLARDIADGTFELKLPKDETRVIGSVAKFYEQIADFTKNKLPPVDFDGLKDPLDNVTKADVTLMEFALKLDRWRLALLQLDVTVHTAWDVPGVEMKIEDLRFRLKYEPDLPLIPAEAESAKKPAAKKPPAG